ncbi:MAG: hypothetical protein ACLQU3_34125 [Limisphaerales bacterium]
MSKLAISVVAAILLVVLSPALLRKRTVPLVSEGKVVAVAKRPFAMPWSDNEFPVYAGKSKVFSLWGDAFDGPLFIFPFADRKRFMCIDDDDTAVLVFVVDFSGPTTNRSDTPGWPPDDYTRKHLADRATNVVVETKGAIRLPSYAEVQEVSRNLVSLTPSQLDAVSFPWWDLGIYRSYTPVEFLLRQLQTNRHSCWPLN